MPIELKWERDVAMVPPSLEKTGDTEMGLHPSSVVQVVERPWSIESPTDVSLRDSFYPRTGGSSSVLVDGGSRARHLR